jgi:hypothetical protein
MYTLQAPAKKLNSFCFHCMRASSEEGEFPYSEGGWVSKLPQEKTILPSYVSWHCHSIVATIKKSAHVFQHHCCYSYWNARFQMS